MIFVILLIGVLIFLILYKFLYTKNRLLENLDNKKNINNENDDEEYQKYRNLENNEKNGPLFLALKNAANISALHSQISGINNLKERISDIENQVKVNNKGIMNLTNHLNQLGKSISQKPK
tara:strand:- start:4164 stop:4526 length:363 start_codon:yes stop_codon:yes gene_type:complete